MMTYYSKTVSGGVSMAEVNVCLCGTLLAGLLEFIRGYRRAPQKSGLERTSCERWIWRSRKAWSSFLTESESGEKGSLPPFAGFQQYKGQYRDLQLALFP